MLVSTITTVFYFIASLAMTPISLEYASIAPQVEAGGYGQIRNWVAESDHIDDYQGIYIPQPELDWVSCQFVRFEQRGFVEVTYQPPANVKPGIYKVKVQLDFPRGDGVSWYRSASFDVDIEVVR